MIQLRERLTKIFLLMRINLICPGGGIGRHKGFKIPRQQQRAGSSPAPGTTCSMIIAPRALITMQKYTIYKNLLNYLNSRLSLNMHIVKMEFQKENKQSSKNYIICNMTNNLGNSKLDSFSHIEDEIDLRDLFKVLFEGKWTILSTTILVLVVSSFLTMDITPVSLSAFGVSVIKTVSDSP